MKNNWKWITGAAIVLLVLFVLPFAFRSFGYSGMMGGYGMGRYPMMGGYGLPLGGLMGFGMLIVWTLPLGLLFLVIYGAVRLANTPTPPTAARSCANCGKTTEADWKNCPYCGKKL